MKLNVHVGALLVTQVVLVMVVFLEIHEGVGFFGSCDFASNINVELQAISLSPDIAWLMTTKI